jgi:hypothetical protein
MTALRAFSALMILLAGVAAGLVDGVMAPPRRPDARSRRCPAPAARRRRRRSSRLEVAQQAERLAVVLADLVLDVADAGVGTASLGERAVAAGLEDRPAGGGDDLVDARLVVAVGDRLRDARAARSPRAGGG